MKAAFALAIMLMFWGCESEQKPSAPSAHSDQGLMRVEGCDGSSIDKAVIIKAANEVIGVRAEYQWIREHHPDWKVKRQTLTSAQKRIYDKMDVITPNGEQVTLYFDITEFFGKF